MNETHYQADCETIREAISAIFDGELEGREAAQTMLHVAQCKACLHFVEETTHLRETLSTWEVTVPDMTPIADLLEQVVPFEKKPQTALKTWLLPLAAVSVLALGGLWFTHRDRPRLEVRPLSSNHQVFSLGPSFSGMRPKQK